MSGVGALDWIRVLDGQDAEGRHLNFMHDDILPPRVSIGVHRHEHDKEYYYVISGRGVMTLDGKRFEVATGDITAVYPGGRYWRNDGEPVPNRRRSGDERDQGSLVPSQRNVGDRGDR